MQQRGFKIFILGKILTSCEIAEKFLAMAKIEHFFEKW
jgi:hypothetical protein